MNQMWGIAAAGLLAIGGTIAGGYLGLLTGRRQVHDQARVEHGQWLRDQRQEAYLQLFEAWDQAVKDLRAFQYEWHDLVEQERDEGYEPWFLVERKEGEVWDRLRRAIDRAELLGPNGVDVAVAGLHAAFRGLRELLREQGRREPYRVDWEAWDRELGKAASARFTFHLAAMGALRTPPAPDRESPP